jgi:hypothetical protein
MQFGSRVLNSNERRGKQGPVLADPAQELLRECQRQTGHVVKIDGLHADVGAYSARVWVGGREGEVKPSGRVGGEGEGGRGAAVHLCGCFN